MFHFIISCTGNSRIGDLKRKGNNDLASFVFCKGKIIEFSREFYEQFLRILIAFEVTY